MKNKFKLFKFENQILYFHDFFRKILLKNCDTTENDDAQT
jgi:hypothetical protein